MQFSFDPISDNYEQFYKYQLIKPSQNVRVVFKFILFTGLDLGKRFCELCVCLLEIVL